MHDIIIQSPALILLIVLVSMLLTICIIKCYNFQRSTQNVPNFTVIYPTSEV